MASASSGPLLPYELPLSLPTSSAALDTIQCPHWEKGRNLIELLLWRLVLP